MADRAFERAFNQALAGHNQDKEVSTSGRREVTVNPEEELRKTATPMHVDDAISRMLLAAKDKDYFRLLELPAPEVDELGRPVWASTAVDVSKAYRRLSMLVHPDKNPGPEAQQAFEALNQAHRLLRDPGEREELLKQSCEAAQRRREAAEAAATPEERVALFAVKKEKAKELQQHERSSYQAEILRQLQEKKERAKRKREKQSSRRRESSSERSAEEDEGGRDDEIGSIKNRGAKSKRGKPKLIF
ncbi:hypothetical protein WJX72_006442 [[Myrmecia] bisecta]|uniref:J domain-containing protein n=1 Tax=[Myrmecia] bisecta TaxID=41462 RepID=A0AAW1Q127_9CHLO